MITGSKSNTQKRLSQGIRNDEHTRVLMFDEARQCCFLAMERQVNKIKKPLVSLKVYSKSL